MRILFVPHGRVIGKHPMDYMQMSIRVTLSQTRLLFQMLWATILPSDARRYSAYFLNSLNRSSENYICQLHRKNVFAFFNCIFAS